jgi:hypothetical protein
VTQDHGTPKPIHSGDHVYVRVEDQAAAWSDRRHTYDVFVFDETTGMYNSRDYSIPSQTGTRRKRTRLVAHRPACVSIC